MAVPVENDVGYPDVASRRTEPSLRGGTKGAVLALPHRSRPQPGMLRNAPRGRYKKFGLGSFFVVLERVEAL